MKTVFIALLFVFGLTMGAIDAQSPSPDIVIQAATPGPAKAKTSGASGPATGDLKAMLEVVQQMKSTNAATIKKQQATLEMLDELQKAADELKIFSKRG
jgi:hypothetical protein